VRIVNVCLAERSYPIYITHSEIYEFGNCIKEHFKHNQVVIITNPTVDKLYSEVVTNSLKSAGYNVNKFIIPDGEEYKNIEWVIKAFDFLLENKYERQTGIIALGGGVIGDIAGFIASTYMRGVPLVQFPTTLLAQVDSSIGGKVGVNHPKLKNAIGAFYQPKCVFIDLSVLKTLPMEELKNGLTEVIKHGFILDSNFFEYLESRIKLLQELDAGVLLHAVSHSCEIKAYVVHRDERESGLRAILNYGHTIGHCIEQLTHYTRYKHGEAVAIGMVVESLIALKMKMIDREIFERQLGILKKADLPTTFPDLKVEDIIKSMRYDKKVQYGKVRFILPTAIGKVVIRDDVPDQIIVNAIMEMPKTS